MNESVLRVNAPRRQRVASAQSSQLGSKGGRERVPTWTPLPQLNISSASPSDGLHLPSSSSSLHTSPRTPPRPPPRPRRSPRRHEVSTPERRPISPDPTSYIVTATEEPSSQVDTSSAHSSAYHSATSSADNSPTSKRLSAVTSDHSTFRLDRPQAYPESFIARRQSLSDQDSLRIEELVNALPGGWNTVVPVAPRTKSNQESEDPEDWARQRRMSSLISGLGIVFGSTTLAETVVEGQEEEGEAMVELEQPVIDPLVLTRVSDPAMILSEGPTTPESVSSDCFESAEEGDEEASWSPSGRRIPARSRSRTSGHSSDNKPFLPSGLSTIVDNSPVASSFNTFRAAEYPASPPSIEDDSGSGSVSFGYACDGPNSEEGCEEIGPATSVRQLVKESWRLSKSSSQEFSTGYEKRMSVRELERLSLEEEFLDLHVAESASPQKSSYTPSARPLALPSPLESPGTLTPSQIPLPPSAPITPSGLTPPSTRNDSYFDVVPNPSRYTTKITIPSDSTNTALSNRRRSASHDPSASSTSSLIDLPSAAPRVQPSPVAPASPLSTRTSPVASPVEQKLRRRMSLDTRAALVHSKPTRRLSTMFNLGRSRQNSKEQEVVSPSQGSIKLRRRDTTSPRTTISPRSGIVTPSSPSATPTFTPTFASPSGGSTAASSPVDNSSPMAGASPFANLTWRSSMSAQEYEKLLARYGRMEMKRQEVIWELCETEKSFVTGLCGVIRVFTLPLRTPSGSWIKGIPAPVSRLLDWLDDIVYLHSQISAALQATRQPHYPVISKIADAFLPFVSRLEVHQPYLVRFEAVTKAIEEMTADSANDFGEFVRIQSALPECGSLPLSSFLLKPVQRLMKYPLFFKVSPLPLLRLLSFDANFPLNHSNSATSLRPLTPITSAFSPSSTRRTR